MTAEPRKSETKNVTWPQWVGGVGVSLLLLQLGLMAAWTSPYVARLLSGESIITITTDEASWIVSLLNLGRLFGAFIGAFCVNYTGSKTSIMISSIPMSLHWFFYIIANNVMWLYLARFLGGMGMGMCYSCFSLYLGEIADPKIRGALVTLGITGTSSGNLIISIMGAYLSLWVSSLINLSLSLILMALFIWLPDTPHYLVQKKDEEKARKAILWYHRNCNVEAEYTTLKKFIESCNTGSTIQGLKEFKVPQIRKAMMVTIMLFLFAQMCGLNNILFYMETILRSAQVTVIEPSIIVIITMSSGIVASLVSMTLIDSFGRKFLMCFSCTIVSIALIGLGTQFQLLESGVDPAVIQWLPIVSVILFQVAAFAGLLAVPSAVVGEIFPPSVKCVAASISSIAAALFSFISASTYQVFVNLMTEKYTFWMYSVLLIIAIPSTLIFLPETKGKSLQEIQDYLMKRRVTEVKTERVEEGVTRY
ncbi:hypothetical protein KPH14_003428 [Odynerus spinipes]|uniref:Major facilitator superfamily (MFS) profile domain-containing protein n=1 Tax=Odynerus spinipes TaxID=1348599 RepID=A0AAD9VJY9_9HYME|nr:hypothetical protein KPH14_003428 [Odynerus spinipes]